MKESFILRWVIGFAVASLIELIPLNCAAQLLGREGLHGDLTSTFEYYREETKPGESAYQNILSRTQLKLRDSGYIIDPRLVTLFATGGVGFLQEWPSGSGSNDDRNEITWNYSINAYILPQKNLSLNLFADRDESFNDRGFAGRIDTLSQNLEAELLIKHLYIPSTISFRQEFRDTESRSRGFLSQNKFRRNVLRYEGRRGWIDQELYARYEYVDFKGESTSASSYDNHEGRLNYSIDFGTDLNWRSDSTLNFLRRSGLTDQSLVNASERLLIDHSDRFRTSYDYNFNRSDNQNGITTTHRGSFSLSHRLYESLATRANLAASFSDFPQGRENQYSGGADLFYTKRLPRGGILNAGLGGNLNYNSNRFSGEENFVSQENHTVTSPFALPIPLNNPFVVEASVVVTKIAFGPLPIGCALPPGPPTDLLVGRDYTLRQIGDVTEIVPIACSGTVPGLNPGDVIAVDYRFSVPRSLTYLETNWNFNVSVDYGWIRPFFVIDQTVNTRLSGEADGFLNDKLSQRIGTELRYDGQRFSANATGEFERFTSDRSDFDRLRFAEWVSFIVNPKMRIRVTGDQFVQYLKDPERDLLGANLRAALSYQWYPNLSSDAFLGMRYFKDSEAPSEFNSEMGLGAVWNYRQVEVIPRLEFFSRQRGETTTNQISFQLKMIRRF